MTQIDVDARRLTDQLTRLVGVCDDLLQIAAQTQGETLGHLIVSANANIYDTAPGAYQRTGDYLRGLEARSRATTNIATITVSNSVDYAGYVEAGRELMSYAVLQQLAILQADPSRPLTLGRSGVNWTRAAPIVTGAQVYAVHRLQQLFAQKVGRVT